jgi:hypothetical protein
MRQNTALVVDLAAVRRERERVLPQRVTPMPLMLVWVPVWFFVPYPAALA